MNMILSIAAGGAVGAVLRHFAGLASLRLIGPDFPWGTVFVNIIGSFIMGALVAVFAHVWQPAQEVKAFLTVGLLGALTTFSTFSLDTAMLWERGNLMATGLYVAGSVGLSIAALFAGLYLVRSVSVSL